MGLLLGFLGFVGGLFGGFGGSSRPKLACNARFLGGWDSMGFFGGFWGFWGLLVSVEFFVGFCWVLGGFAGVFVGFLVGFNGVWGFVGGVS